MRDLGKEHMKASALPTPGKATLRAADSLNASFPRSKRKVAALLRKAQELAATKPYHAGLTSAEHLLEVAGVPPERIPVLAARLRSGTKSKIDFKQEGVTL